MSINTIRHKKKRIGLKEVAVFIVFVLLASKLLVFRENRYTLLVVKSIYNQDQLVDIPTPNFDLKKDKIFFRFFLSHIYSAQENWELADSECAKINVDRGGIEFNRFTFIQDICDARGAAAAGRWEDSLEKLALATSEYAHLIPVFNQELFILKNRSLSDNYNRISRTWVTTSVACTKDQACESLAETCISVAVEELLYPGGFRATVSHPCQEDAKKEIILSNLISNPSFSIVSKDQRPLGVSDYYYRTSGNETVLKIENATLGSQLIIPPRKNVVPDIIKFGIFPVAPESVYSFGVSSKGDIDIGCIWWGDQKVHGKMSMNSHLTEDWNEIISTTTVPDGAKKCVLVIFNQSNLKEAQLDWIFFTPIDKSVLVGN